MSDSISIGRCFPIESSFEDGVEFVGLINKQGRIIDSAYKNKTFFPISKNEMLFMTASLISSLQKEFDDDFGSVQFSITERENSKSVSIPTRFGVIFAIMKKGFDHRVIVNKIKNMEILSKSDIIKST